MISMLGFTNSGKTLSATCMMSIYGQYKRLRIGKKDTLNAKIEKMAMLGNLPVYMDELTNIEPADLSQLVYQVSEGRGRARLRSDSTMREAAEWQTLGVASTNASLVGKLALGKDNAEAEMMRLLEYRVENIAWFERQMTDIYGAVTKNYGHAGEAYVQYLVKADKDTLKAEIDKVVEGLREAVGFSGQGAVLGQHLRGDPVRRRDRPGAGPARLQGLRRHLHAAVPLGLRAYPVEPR